MVGIDKVQVTTRDYQIREVKRELFGFGGTKQGKEAPYLLTDKKGNNIHAPSIYRNTEYGQYSINEHGLQVQFNPSKLYHPYHLLSTGETFDKIVKQIDHDLGIAGILCNVYDMRFSRVDITDQHQMENPPVMYNSVCKLFSGKRSKQQREYPNGYEIGNTQSKTMFYDKLQKLHDDKQDKYIQGESNLLRIENKWLNSKVIRSNLPFDTLEKLQKLTPNDVTTIYKNHLRDKVFTKHMMVEQTVLDFKDQSEILQQMVHGYTSISMAAIAHLAMIAGADIDTAILGFGGIAGYRNFLENTGICSRKHTYSIIRTIEQAIKDKAKYSTDGRVTVSTLLHEVQSKFAA